MSQVLLTGPMFYFEDPTSGTTLRSLPWKLFGIISGVIIGAIILIFLIPRGVDFFQQWKQKMEEKNEKVVQVLLQQGYSLLCMVGQVLPILLLNLRPRVAKLSVYFISSKQQTHEYRSRH